MLLKGFFFFVVDKVLLSSVLLVLLQYAVKGAVDGC